MHGDAVGPRVRSASGSDLSIEVSVSTLESVSEQLFKLADPFRLVEGVGKLPHQVAHTVEIDLRGMEKQEPLDILLVAVSPGNRLVDDEILGLSDRNRHAAELHLARPLHCFELERKPPQTDLERRSTRSMLQEQDLSLARELLGICDSWHNLVRLQRSEKAIEVDRVSPDRGVDIDGEARDPTGDHRDTADDHGGSVKCCKGPVESGERLEDRPVRWRAHGLPSA